jgi:hypothetical protein
VILAEKEPGTEDVHLGGEGMILRPPCHKSDCEVCLRHTRQRYQETVQFWMNRREGGVFRTYVEAETWAPVKRRLQRNRASYFTIAAGGIREVTSTVPINDSSVAMSPQAAASRVCCQLRVMPFTDPKSFTFSASWAPLKTKRKPRPKRKLLARGMVDFGKAAQGFDERGEDWAAFQFQQDGRHIDGMKFRVPNTLAECDKLVSNLLAGETLPDIDIDDLFPSGISRARPPDADAGKVDPGEVFKLDEVLA